MHRGEVTASALSLGDPSESAPPSTRGDDSADTRALQRRMRLLQIEIDWILHLLDVGDTQGATIQLRNSLDATALELRKHSLAVSLAGISAETCARLAGWLRGERRVYISSEGGASWNCRLMTGHATGARTYDGWGSTEEAAIRIALTRAETCIV